MRDLQPSADETIDRGPRQVIATPEQVALELAIAGPTSRMLAYAIDYAVILGTEIGMVVLLFVVAPAVTDGLVSRVTGTFSSQGPGKATAEVLLLFLTVLLLVQLVLEWVYFVACEASTGGRSLGKALVGLRVVRDGGLAIGLRESLVRNLLRAVDLLPWYYAVGLIAVVASPEGKRLGDLAAGTIVVRLDRPPPAPEPLEGRADAGFRFDRDQIGRLGPAELTLLRETLRRLDALPPARAADALERASVALAERIGHAPVRPEEREAFLRALLRASRMR